MIRRSRQISGVDSASLEDNRMCVKDMGLAHFHSVGAENTTAELSSQDGRKVFTVPLSPSCKDFFNCHCP